MLHMPIDVDIETALEAGVKSWFAFAAQKTDELVVLALALAEGRDEVAAGVYDIHSPGIPEAAEISNLVMLARHRLLDGQLWGESRLWSWEEVRPALMNMMAAARAIREKAETA
ncbi:hypothetical protein [Mesorhizobium captivum]|uniref:hypothetical protein n=1 Tax=Mesorhizobium captivum TaxID=3072319 RepID=UPI002A245E3F|nr:hypothetical protein [Mesorhizobium sp. VK22E]MDX8509795.1 hypothetical protein [Mesorhizobium sp. VK22E]